jgi:hypothetical protein
LLRIEELTSYEIEKLEPKCSKVMDEKLHALEKKLGKFIM